MNIDDTMNAAVKTMNDVKETAGHSATRVRSTLLDGLHAAADAMTLLRSLGLSDALGWVGLERRRGPVMPIMTFGAGFLAGAAVGVLAAPMSGAQMRRQVAQKIMGLEHQAADTLAHGTSEVGAKANEIAEKAKETAHRVGDATTHQATNVKNAVKGAFADATEAAKDGGKASATSTHGSHVS